VGNTGGLIMTTTIYQKITTDKVKETIYKNVPNNLKMWQCDVCGPMAVVTAIDELLQGKRNSVAIAGTDHPNKGGLIREIKRYTVRDDDDGLCLEYENSAVIPTWYKDECFSLPYVSAEIVYSFRKSECLFILKD
jgi:hypothetical protein